MNSSALYFQTRWYLPIMSASFYANKIHNLRNTFTQNWQAWVQSASLKSKQSNSNGKGEFAIWFFTKILWAFNLTFSDSVLEVHNHFLFLYKTSFTSNRVKLRLIFTWCLPDVYFMFTWRSPDVHLTTWPSSDLPLTLTRPLPYLD